MSRSVTVSVSSVLIVGCLAMACTDVSVEDPLDPVPSFSLESLRNPSLGLPTLHSG